MHTYSYHLGTATKFTGVISREIFACCSCCCCCPWQPSQLVKIETRREEERGCFSHKEYFFSPSPSSSAWLSSVIKTLQLKVTTNFWGPSTIYSYKRTNEQKVKRQKIFSSFSLCSFVLFGSFCTSSSFFCVCTRRDQEEIKFWGTITAKKPDNTRWLKSF